MSRIEGHVNDALEPVIEIGLCRGETVTTIPAVVDTGFSGQLCLSARHIEHLEMVFKYVERYELANGELTVEDVFQGTISFGGEERVVDLIVTNSQDTLIGASLLSDRRLTIDYPAKRVLIE